MGYISNPIPLLKKKPSTLVESIYYSIISPSLSTLTIIFQIICSNHLSELNPLLIKVNFEIPGISEFIDSKTSSKDSNPSTVITFHSCFCPRGFILLATPPAFLLCLILFHKIFKNGNQIFFC